MKINSISIKNWRKLMIHEKSILFWWWLKIMWSKIRIRFRTFYLSKDRFKICRFEYQYRTSQCDHGELVNDDKYKQLNVTYAHSTEFFLLIRLITINYFDNIFKLFIIICVTSWSKNIIFDTHTSQTSKKEYLKFDISAPRYTFFF